MDAVVYQRCFSDKEFSSMLYADDTVNMDYFLCDNPGKQRLIVSISIGDSRQKTVGFVQLQDNGDNQQTIIGGVFPEYFNKGIAVFCVVAVLSHIFAIAPEKIVTTGILLRNCRSLKMMTGVGFRRTSENSQRINLQLSYNDFADNDFVDRIKQKIDVVYDSGSSKGSEYMDA